MLSGFSKTIRRLQFLGLFKKQPAKMLTTEGTEANIFIWQYTTATGTKGVKEAIIAFDNLCDWHRDPEGGCFQQNNSSVSA